VCEGGGRSYDANAIYLGSFVDELKAIQKLHPTPGVIITYASGIQLLFKVILTNTGVLNN
jgi:hypothetical protein